MKKRIKGPPFLSIFVFLLLAASYGHSATTTQCDFNNDGYDDLAVGVPGEKVAGKWDAGAVQVLYGRSTGIGATNNQIWHLASTNVPGDPNSSVFFGWSLACGDFNGDQADDLAIGAPEDIVNGEYSAGSVTVLYGSTTWRLKSHGSQRWTQDSANVPDSAEYYDLFGTALATGDFNGDGFADLAVGSPGETLDTPNGPISGAGSVYVFSGSANGITSAGTQLWTQNSSGIAEDPADSEHFGWVLASGDFGKNSSSGCYDDLAITVDEDTTLTSAVQVLYGSASGLAGTASELWNLESFGLSNAMQVRFGHGLATGYFGGSDDVCAATKIADLVIGAPGFSMSGAVDEGVIFILSGTETGLSAANLQMWSQGSPGVADDVEAGDHFGEALATGQLSDGRNFVVIGSPYEDLYSTPFRQYDAGAVHVLYTEPQTARLTGWGSSFYHQDTPGIKDFAEQPDTFGSAVATGDFNGDGSDDIAVGAPREEVKGVWTAGAIHIIYGNDALASSWFHQDSVDMKNTIQGSDSFGSSFCGSVTLRFGWGI